MDPISAGTLARSQRSISVSEFFLRNRHLLGFDSPHRAVLTAVKEAVDNSLDACEEAGILPEIRVSVENVTKSTYRVCVEDNGPGIVVEQLARVFGKLLYGSKFHRLFQSRGQQGMGISAAGMYGQLTTGEPMRVVSRTSADVPAREIHVSVDTAKNRPDIHEKRDIEWHRPHGTRIEITMEGHYHRGQHSVPMYLMLTSIANPHVRLHLTEPDGTTLTFDRSTSEPPPIPKGIKPHPYGVELGRLIAMLKQTEARDLRSFLRTEFCQVGRTRADQIIERAGSGLSARSYPKRVARAKAVALHRAIAEVKIPAPPSDCVVPIGEEGVRRGLELELPATFYAVTTRPTAVYRGNPFAVEVGLAYGHAERRTTRLIRFANRVPLLYQQSDCVMTRAVSELNWRHYGLAQTTGALPTGPLTILVHVASVWVPFTSESKEAVSSYPEIAREIELALRACGRKLATFLRKEHRLDAEREKRREIEKYLPHVAAALSEIVGMGDEERENIATQLDEAMRHERRTV